MGYFPVRYDSRVIIYERKMFIRLATGHSDSIFPENGLGAHSGVVFNGIPMFCGGSDDRAYFKHCYKFNSSAKYWEKVLLNNHYMS